MNADPGSMSDSELLSHVHTIHGPIPLLTHSPEYMTAGVMLRVRDCHDEWHTELHSHTHEYPLIGETVMEDWKGVHYRENDEGLGKPGGVWLVMCPEPHCHYSVSAPDEDTANARLADHNCPHEGITHYGADVTVTLILECWKYADQLYVMLDGEMHPDQRQQVRGELKGICKAISIFMPQYFPTVRAVADEVRKRANMREAEETYETPGTMTRIFEAPKPAEPKVSVLERAKRVLDEDTRKAIKFAFDSGMFSKESLAETYDVTVAVIEEVCS